MSTASVRTTGLTSVRIGRMAWVTGWFALALAPIHALARFATVAGSEDLESPIVRAWAEPAADLLAPLMTWSDPDTVYISYGKLWLVVIAVAVAAAITSQRSRAPIGAERWAWRVAISGYAIVALGIFVTYWTPWLEPGFGVVMVGMLVGMLGSTVLGVMLLRSSYRPVTTGWLLALWIPLLFVLSSVVALGAGLLPLVWAWALATRRAPRGHPSPIREVPRVTRP